MSVGKTISFGPQKKDDNDARASVFATYKMIHSKSIKSFQSEVHQLNQNKSEVQFPIVLHQSPVGSLVIPMNQQYYSQKKLLLSFVPRKNFNH